MTSDRARRFGEVFAECFECRTAHVMLDPFRVGVRVFGIDPQRYQKSLTTRWRSREDTANRRPFSVRKMER